MKLTKRSLLLILIAIFLIVAFVLNSARSQRTEERDELSEKLATTQSRVRAIQLEPLSSRKAELEGQLNDTTSQLDVVKAILSQPIKKNTTMAVLFNTAKAYSLEITRMTLAGLTDAAIEGIPASSVVLTVTVKGDLLSLIAFVTKLNSLYDTGAGESVAIINPKTDSGEKPSADINLTLYTIQGR